MKKKENFCPICKNRKIKIISDITKYYFCHSCLSARLASTPKIRYDDDYYEGKSSLAARLFVPISNAFYKIRQAYIGNVQVGTWVDVGAGKGEFLKMVRAKRRIGVEVSNAGRKIMGKNNLETMLPGEFLKRKNIRAGVVSFWHVLEHIEKPWIYLSAARNNLNKNGKIVIGAPNINSLEYKLFGTSWFHFQPLYHLWHFSPKSMTLLLNRAGFKVDKVDYCSIEHQPAGILQSFINVTSGSDNMLHKLVKRGTDKTSFSFKDFCLSFFWLTFGLPAVMIFWFLEIIVGKPGTFVIVASKIKD